MSLGKVLKQFSEDTGIEQKEIAQKLGYTPQRVGSYFRDLSKPPFEFYDKFLKFYKVDLRTLVKAEAEGGNKVAAYNPIPVYDLEMKNVKALDFFNHSDLIAFYIDAPMYNDCFAAVRVSGVAMAPAFEASDITPIRRIENFDTVPYGEPFLIITEEQRLFRYIRKSEKNPEKMWLLRAENPNSDDITINKDDVLYLFQIKGKMTRR